MAQTCNFAVVLLLRRKHSKQHWSQRLFFSFHFAVRFFSFFPELYIDSKFVIVNHNHFSRNIILNTPLITHDNLLQESALIVNRGGWRKLQFEAIIDTCIGCFRDLSI